MAPNPAHNEDDFIFMMCCAKHTEGKPDFEAVAVDTGCKDKMAAYKRHWAIMKKWENVDGTGVGSPKKKQQGKKRGSKAKKDVKQDEIVDEDEDNEADGVEESPTKKAKVEAEAEEGADGAEVKHEN